MLSSSPPPGSDPRDALFDVSALAGGIGRKTGRSASIVLGFSGLRFAMTLLTTAVLARLVPPAEQGIVALAMPIVLLATGLSEFGLAQAVIQRKDITHRVVSALLWINVALGAALGLVVVLLAGPATMFYGTPEIYPILIALAPYVVFSALAVPFVAILRRRMEIRTAELCNFAGIVAAAMLSIVAAVLGAGPWALVIQLVAAQGIAFLCLVFAVRWMPSAPWNSALSEARSAIVFGGFLSAERLLNELVASSQTAIIGRAFGNLDAGLFYRVLTLSQMPRRRIVAPLSGVFVPSLSRLQDKAVEFRAMYIRQISRGNLILLPAGLLMILIPDAIVLILLGDAWLDAAVMLTWLGLQPLTVLFASCNSWALVATGKARQLFFTRLFSAVFVITVLLLAVPYGIVTFVASYVIAQTCVGVGLMALVVMRYTPIDLRTIWAALASDLVFCASVLGLGFGVRAWLSQGVIIEGILTGALVAGLLGLRILITPGYRRDILQIFRR